MFKIIKNLLNYKIKNYIYKIKSEIPERNRFLILSLALLFLMDYLLFCYISERNPLNIFPTMPVLENKKLISIYLPDIDGKTILKEDREISFLDDIEGYTKMLIQKVINGSNVENTSIVVPVDIFIRKIWFYQDICILDIVPSLLTDTAKLIHSEKTFKESLERTITDNIPSVKKIIILERGIPGRSIWGEYSLQM